MNKFLFVKLFGLNTFFCILAFLSLIYRVILPLVERIEMSIDRARVTREKHQREVYTHRISER